MPDIKFDSASEYTIKALDTLIGDYIGKIKLLVQAIDDSNDSALKSLYRTQISIYKTDVRTLSATRTNVILMAAEN